MLFNESATSSLVILNVSIFVEEKRMSVNSFKLVSFAPLLLFTLSSCGGGGGGSSVGEQSSTVQTPKVIRINQADTSYRVANIGDAFVYDVTATTTEYDVAGGVLSENSYSTTLDREFYAPSPSNDFETQLIPYWEDEGFTILKEVLSYGTGDQIIDSTQGHRSDSVVELWDEDGVIIEETDEGTFRLVFHSPPLNTGDTFGHDKVIQYQEPWVNGADYWMGSREFNVSGTEVLDLPFARVEVYKVLYRDKTEKLEYRPNCVVCTPGYWDGSYTYLSSEGYDASGTLYFHPKIGLVKLQVTVRSGTGIDDEGELLSLFESTEQVWELRDVNFQVPNAT